MKEKPSKNWGGVRAGAGRVAGISRKSFPSFRLTEDEYSIDKPYVDAFQEAEKEIIKDLAETLDCSPYEVTEKVYHSLLTFRQKLVNDSIEKMKNEKERIKNEILAAAAAKVEQIPGIMRKTCTYRFTKDEYNIHQLYAKAFRRVEKSIIKDLVKTLGCSPSEVTEKVYNSLLIFRQKLVNDLIDKIENEKESIKNEILAGAGHIPGIMRKTFPVWQTEQENSIDKTYEDAFRTAEADICKKLVKTLGCSPSEVSTKVYNSLLVLRQQIVKDAIAKIENEKERIENEILADT